MIKIIKSSEVREPKIYINTFKEKQPRDKIIDDKLIFFLILWCKILPFLACKY